MSADDHPGFRELTGCYEPSGIFQLADGRFIVVEDEAQCPLSLLHFDDSGPVDCTPLRLPSPHRDDDDHWRLDDLEAVTGDHAGCVYAITSHSRDNAGDERSAREKLLRFRVAGGEMVEARLVVDLKRALTAAPPSAGRGCRPPAGEEGRRPEHRRAGNAGRPACTDAGFSQPTA
jgi:hypothetical protein